MTPGAEELLRAFLDASTAGRAYQELGDRYARLAREIADKARDYWVASGQCFDAAERAARELGPLMGDK